MFVITCFDLLILHIELYLKNNLVKINILRWITIVKSEWRKHRSAKVVV